MIDNENLGEYFEITLSCKKCGIVFTDIDEAIIHAEKCALGE